MIELDPRINAPAANLDAMAAVVRGYVGQGDDQPDWVRLLAPDCVYEDWSFDRIEGADGIRRDILEPYVDSFADAHHVIHELISDSSRLVLVGDFFGRFIGQYVGIPPTGNTVTWPVRDIWTFCDGKVVRIDIASDTLRSGRALGLVPDETQS